MSLFMPGAFYFLKDEFYEEFADEPLMENKNEQDGALHGRPCYFAFRDSQTGLAWMIPISSRIQKFHALEHKIVKRYGRCDTIKFSEMLGAEKAFLLQNMFPVDEKWIECEYVSNGIPVRTENNFAAYLKKTASNLIALERRGIKVVFPNIVAMEKCQLSNNSENGTNS